MTAEAYSAHCCITFLPFDSHKQLIGAKVEVFVSSQLERKYCFSFDYETYKTDHNFR
jgi:hypothetical protein